MNEEGERQKEKRKLSATKNYSWCDNKYASTYVKCQRAKANNCVKDRGRNSTREVLRKKSGKMINNKMQNILSGVNTTRKMRCKKSK